jgi:Uma2 family endonuclease
MRVKINATGLYTYHDLVVVCGSPQFEDLHRDTLVNPSLIVEVLSKSTEGYDRGERFAHYRKLESLTEYLLVSQGKPQVDRYVRQADNQWLLAEWEALPGEIPLTSINCSLLMSEIYDKVAWRMLRRRSVCWLPSPGGRPSLWRLMELKGCAQQ